MKLKDVLELARMNLREMRQRRIACRILRSMVDQGAGMSEEGALQAIDEMTLTLISDPGFPIATEREWRLIVSGFVLPLLISGPAYFLSSKNRGDTMAQERETLRVLAARWTGYHSRHCRVESGRDALFALVEQLPILIEEKASDWKEFNQAVVEFAVEFLPLLACMRMKEQRICLRPRLLAPAGGGVACG